MAASDRTVRDVLAVLQRHLRPHELLPVLTDLACVRGNASFSATVNALLDLARAEVDAEGAADGR